MTFSEQLTLPKQASEQSSQERLGLLVQLLLEHH
jgi:hypothetical protein